MKNIFGEPDKPYTRSSGAPNYAQSIVDAIHEPSMVVDYNLTVVSANHSYYEAFKAGNELVEGKRIYEIIDHQWDFPAFKTLLEVLLPEKQIVKDYEVTHEFKHIGTHTFLIHASQLKVEKGQEGLILISFKDITERMEFEEKENYHLRSFQNILKQAPAAMCTLRGPDHVFELVNEQYLQLVGKEDIVGKSVRKALPEVSNQGFIEVLDNVYRTGKPYVGNEVPLKMDILGKGSKVYYVDFVYQPTWDKEGKVDGIFAHAVDMTEKVLARKKIEESEHKYQELIHSSPSLIATFQGEDYVIEIANDAILEAWGRDSDVIGKPLLSAIPELIEQGFEEMLEGVYKTGNPYKAYERPVQLLRGGKLETVYFNFIYYPQRDVHGNIVGIVDVATEVTPQALLNKQIKESESHFRQMADLMPNKVSNTDAEGNFIYFNQNWLDYTGLSSEDLKQKGWAKFIHPEEKRNFEKQWQKSLNSGRSFEMELRCLDKNGRYNWHLNRTEAVKDEAGQIKMWIGTNTEIQRLKEEEKQKEDFLKMVSHELKTPVTSIKGYVQLLLTQLKMTEESKKYSFPLISSLERVDQQIVRLTRLIAEMLDLSRIEENKLELQKQKFSINELVTETVQDMSYTNTQHKIEVYHDFSCSVFADKDRIGQVLINFITNAIKYSPDSQNVEIRIQKADNHQVSVSIKDWGIGIDKKSHKNIFKRFYRIGGKSEETYSGFGIGLYLANEIIQRHKGAIKVKSKKGAGSEFSFTLAVA